MAATRPHSPGAGGFADAATKRRDPKRSITAVPLAPGSPDRRKYTVRIDAEPAERFERAVLDMIGTVGRRVDKSEVMRVLSELFATDAEVAGKVADALRRQ